MAPTKVEAPIRTTRKTHSATIYSQKQAVKVENPIQPKGVVYVDAIPSPVIEPVIPTVFKE
jgi:hypothetical protein